MYLKNLTVFGFKSFAEKTSLNFLPGITAIVGPNGCGKSNVSDAIRWVLGEQSAKALRGGEMADVIFSGTDTRKPLGLAEVSLTIGGVDADHLKAAGVEIAYNEVTLTRRVFRDGGSEYFLNKIPCRLKDIQQLFMGTGVGRTSYSIMAQGNITQLLSSRPEDRRMVFEEAAGVTRFKAQKKEALRKLEGTEQNLLRVADLIREVKRQIGSLQRQAGKARRYKQYQAELQYLETQLARHQYDLLAGEIAERRRTLETLRAEIEQCGQGVLHSEHEIGQLRERLAELERAISAGQQRGLELKAEIERHQSRIQYCEERQRDLEQREARALADIAQAEERCLATEQELAQVSAAMEEATARLAQRRLELQTRREAMAALESELRLLQDAARLAQTDAFAAAQQLTRARNEINALELQKQGNLVRLEKLSAEKVQLEEERGRLEARLESFARDTEAEKQQVQVRRLSVEETQQRLRAAQQELNQVTSQLDLVQRQQAEQRSRLNVLEQLQAAHEGFGAGALAALRSHQTVLGTLTDRMRVPDQYVLAVEAALGHHLQLILTEQPETAQDILADLSAHKKGRVSLVSLAMQPGDQGAAQGVAELEPAAPFGADATRPASGPPAGSPRVAALSVIQADEAIRPLLTSLLGRTWIVPDLPTATTSWRQAGGGREFGPPGGAVPRRHGVFTGGAINGSGQAPSSILGRKNQIAELAARLAGLQERINETSRAKGALQSELTSLQASLHQAQTELRTQEVAIATRQGEFNALQHAQRVLHQKIDTVVYEIQSLASQQQQAEAARSELAGRLTDLEGHEAELQRGLASRNVQLESLRQQRETAHAALTESKVALATEEQVSASLRNRQGPLTTRIAELRESVLASRREMDSFREKKAQAAAEAADALGRIGALRHEREQESLRLGALLGQRESLEAEIAAREDTLRDQRRHQAMVQEQRGAVEVELAQKEMALQNLRERIQQKYQLNLAEVRGEGITITFAGEGPAKVVKLTPEEMAAAGVATDWDAVATQVGALQKRLDEIGPVNLVAIEEYEETEQRYQFLTTQHDDLVKAKGQLVEVINRVNAQTRQMFQETFGKIRENFRVLFAELFGEGKADLYLVDEGDVLESGIEIVARPPGKQLQSISLLSGGEQTMTAVALLFAIYQVKPSPFCVLDELDAPLDESNINRFVRILQRFLAHSQFIIITHNKRTIAMADVLYGITMQERGVSKIVSVKFHRTGEVVLDHTPVLLEPPAPVKPVEEEEDQLQPRENTLELAVAN